MKRIFFLITLFIIFVQAFLFPVQAEVEPVKVMSMHYDNSSSLVYIATKDFVDNRPSEPLRYIPLENPNRIYFDINDAVLIGEKQQLVFEKSVIKEIRLAQFETNPRNIVRMVITFEEDFDTSKIKLFSLDGNIFVKIGKLKLSNDYFNTIYDENTQSEQYSNITANSQFVQRVTIPVANQIKAPENVMDDIQRAFEGSTLANASKDSYDSVVSVDLSSALKLRTKYFVNKYWSAYYCENVLS